MKKPFVISLLSIILINSIAAQVYLSDNIWSRAIANATVATEAINGSSNPAAFENTPSFIAVGNTLLYGANNFLSSEIQSAFSVKNESFFAYAQSVGIESTRSNRVRTGYALPLSEKLTSGIALNGRVDNLNEMEQYRYGISFDVGLQYQLPADWRAGMSANYIGENDLSNFDVGVSKLIQNNLLFVAQYTYLQDDYSLGVGARYLIENLRMSIGLDYPTENYSIGGGMTLKETWRIDGVVTLNRVAGQTYGIAIGWRMPQDRGRGRTSRIRF